jgi:hypothetical protein
LLRSSFTWSWKTTPQHDAATTMLHCRGGARFPPDVTLGIQAKEFNQAKEFHQTRESCVWESFRWPG